MGSSINRWDVQAGRGPAYTKRTAHIPRFHSEMGVFGGRVMNREVLIGGGG